MSALAIKVFFPEIKIVFDTRSPFPEENVTMGRWSHHSLTFSFWKWVERRAFKSFDSIIFTSAEQARTHDPILINSKFKIIRNNSANSNFYRSRADFINKSKKDSADGCFVYAYVGSADRSGWNRPGPYIEFIKVLMSLPGRSMVVFITSSAALFKDELEAAGIPEDFYRIYTCDPEFVAEHLLGCHAGLNLMTSVDTRMSVKTADYYGNGLPVICNSNVLGCVELIESSGAGIILQDGHEVQQLMSFQKNYADYQARASSMSELFSVERVAKSYIDVYKSFLVDG
jgi:glycosyltransferase involved in cell wall biosynthesis